MVRVRPRAGHRGWKDICPGAAHGNGEVALKEVASKPLSANLCKQVCEENLELAAPVSEITTVAKEAVAVRKKLLDEALQTLRRVGSRSTAAGAPKRRCDSRGAEVEARREASCAELAQAQNCVVSDSISPTSGHRR